MSIPSKLVTLVACVFSMKGECVRYGAVVGVIGKADLNLPMKHSILAYQRTSLFMLRIPKVMLIYAFQVDIPSKLVTLVARYLSCLV